MTAANQYQQTLAVNPTNANNIVISAKTGTAENAVSVFATMDGGSTWTETTFSNVGDPFVSFDASGNCFLTVLLASGTALYGSKSTTGGMSWPAISVIFAGSVDHPVAVGPYIIARDSSGPNVNLSKLSGGTWSTTSVNATASGVNGDFISPATLLSSGTLIASAQGTDPHRIWTVKWNGSVLSVNDVTNGNTLATLPGGMSSGSNGSGGTRTYLPVVQYDGSSLGTLRLQTSDDDATTWSALSTIFVGTATNNINNVASMVNAAGVVMLFWLGWDTTANTFDAYVVYSKDYGGTWSGPLKVSTVSSANLGSIQGVPFTSSQPRRPQFDQITCGVGPDGKFYVVWQDARTGSSYTTYMRSVSVG